MVKSYKAIFGKAIADFNSGKKPSKCKTVESYMSEIVNDKRGRRHTVKDKDGHTKIAEDAREGKSLYYEFVVSAGNSESRGAVQYDNKGRTVQPEQLPRVVQARILDIYYRSFADRNPNLILIGYAIHGDEIYRNKYDVYNYATTHAHGCVVPVAEFKPTTDKNGRVKHPLRLQNSMNKALAAMGLKSYEDWVKREQAYLEQITVQVYQDYCRVNNKSDDIEIYHPVTSKRRLGGLTQTQFQAQQTLKEEKQTLAAEREQLELDKKLLAVEREQVAREMQIIHAIHNAQSSANDHYSGFVSRVKGVSRVIIDNHADIMVDRYAMRYQYEHPSTKDRLFDDNTNPIEDRGDNQVHR
ncbi:MAG: hypothetical protein IJ784_03360 [Ruminiclostridium sp.]|nr:hypothetical protein [Ruminiclostridium sp.]